MRFGPKYREKSKTESENKEDGPIMQTKAQVIKSLTRYILVIAMRKNGFSNMEIANVISDN